MANNNQMPRLVLAVIPSDDGKRRYELRRGGDGVVYCSCPAWKFSKNHVCKHMLRAAVEPKVVELIDAPDVEWLRRLVRSQIDRQMVKAW